jgi:hypothetical protein
LNDPSATDTSIELLLARGFEVSGQAMECPLIHRGLRRQA